MADGADATGKLSKLARLKSLKSGLKATEKVVDDESMDLSLDSVLFEDEAEGAAPTPPVGETPPPKPVAKAAEQEGESLSSYFEALGIVPDNAKVDGATGKAPDSYSAPSDAYTVPTIKKEPGREVDERDLWADPVRNDDTFLSSFAAGGAPAPEAEDDTLTLDSIIGSFEDEEGGAPDPTARNEPEPEPDAEPDALDRSIDIEAFEAEIALNDSELKDEGAVIYVAPEPVAEPEAAQAEEVEADQPLTITFDENRASLLSHVSKQMGCSIDDVVVTAIDWYLDALFGEEDPDVAAGQGD